MRSVCSGYTLTILVGVSATSGLALAASPAPTPSPKVPELVLVQRTTLPQKDPVFSVSHNMRPGPETPVGTRVTLRGKTFGVSLGSVKHDTARDRVIAYGQSPFSHDPRSHFSYALYSKEGNLILSLNDLSFHPYDAAVSDDGSFVLAGNSSPGGTKPNMFVAQYDLNGQLKWKTPLAGRTPRFVTQSPRHQWTALLHDPSDDSSMKSRAAPAKIISVYDSKGKSLFSEPVDGTTYAVAFVGEKKMVLCDSIRWHLLDVSRGFRKITSGALKAEFVDEGPSQGDSKIVVLKSRFLNQMPIKADSKTSVFAILSRPVASTQKITIQLLRAEDGSVLGEGTYESDEPISEYDNLLQFNEDGTLGLRFNKELLTLKLPDK